MNVRIIFQDVIAYHKIEIKYFEEIVTLYTRGKILKHPAEKIPLRPSFRRIHNFAIMSPHMTTRYLPTRSLIHFQQTLPAHLVNQFYRAGRLTRRATSTHASLRYERIRQILPRTRSPTANFSARGSAEPPLPPSAGRVVRVLTRATHRPFRKLSATTRRKMYDPLITHVLVERVPSFSYFHISLEKEA